jgi:hypothetical protein
MELSGQFHTPAAFPKGKSPCYPLDRKLGGPRTGLDAVVERKNSQPLPGLEPSIIQPIA